MINKNQYDGILIYHRSLEGNLKAKYKFTNDFYSLTLPHIHKKIKVIFWGEISNINEICSTYKINYLAEEQLIAELFDKHGDKIFELIYGNFVIILAVDDKIIFLKDYFGLENLYYSKLSNNKIFAISNRISLLKKVCEIQVNNDFLPYYFLMNNNLGFETPLKYVYRLPNYRLGSYTYKTNEIKFDFIGNDPLSLIKETYMNQEDVKNNLNMFLNASLKTVIELRESDNIVTMMSGGIDSSYLAVLLEKYGVRKSVCVSFKDTGYDAKYSIDIANSLKLQHKIINIDDDQFYNGILESIKASEMPYGFQGEAQFFNIFNSYGKLGKNLFISGQGSDGLFSLGRELRILNYILKFRLDKINYDGYTNLLPNKYNNTVKILLAQINSNKISDKFLESYFGLTNQKKEVIAKLLGITDLSNILNIEKALFNNSPNSLMKKIHLLHSYYGEVTTIPNVLNSIARSQNSKIIFPFLNKDLFNFAKNLDIDVLLKKDGKKYHLRKMLAQNVPAKFVYRKKISMNIPFMDIFNRNKNFKELINDIINSDLSHYKFFDKKIFQNENYDWLWMKLINLYLWKKNHVNN